MVKWHNWSANHQCYNFNIHYSAESSVISELQPVQVDLNYKVSDSKEAADPLFNTIEMETKGLLEAV